MLSGRDARAPGARTSCPLLFPPKHARVTETQDRCEIARNGIIQPTT
jgi:hypothetical protein